MPYPNLRRTRIVCISDTHNTYPKLPAGDVLIHAGDLTNQGSLSELQRTVNWLESTDFEAKIVVAGNHDVTLDQTFYAQYSSYFHNQSAQDPEECKALLLNSSLLYLEHETATVELKGAGTSLKIFGSPFSPRHGLWAFGYDAEEAGKLWAQIPLDADVVITHTPPKYHLDEHSQRGSVGCASLREALWRVRPILHVCGHVHEGRGAESIRWDLQTPHVQFKEKETLPWPDLTGATKKQFKIDLSSGPRTRSKTLPPPAPLTVVAEVSSSHHPHYDTTSSPSTSSPSHVLTATNDNIPPTSHLPNAHTIPPPSPRRAFRIHATTTGTAAVWPPPLSTATKSEKAPEADACAITAAGSGRVDDEDAQARRHERTETCVVNAAHMGSNWPHRGSGGRRLNKPVVVDVLLPVVDEC